ncbi:MAG: 30S ribosomal protein S16 [Crocinitomicaceae bacterium]|nr:30S ribosomal protein S16 [Crocinitomicaceae bacterium]|tara:strand:+ start:99017 stop:99697 length:681 start_codon:yes stop_codon:yes gene_type:complete
MATKIRLQRHGKKGNPYYYIVAADSRVKRDGKYIERLGDYDPNTNPAIINIDFDRALYWVKTGAQPTDTARAILSYKGIMMKNHLDKGVLKGAHTQAQADAKFEKWVAEKSNKIEGKVDTLKKAEGAEAAKRLAAEKEVNEKRLAEFQAKEAELHAAAEAAAAPAPVEEAAETATDVVEEVVETVEEVVEAVTEKAEEVAEKVTEASTEESSKEETPAAEEEKKEG